MVKIAGIIIIIILIILIIALGAAAFAVYTLGKEDKSSSYDR